MGMPQSSPNPRTTPPLRDSHRTIRQRPLGLNNACAVGKGGLHKQGGGVSELL